ncbi:MAG: TIGR02206 family membrane protein [Planctomycetota bacterium]
MFSPMHAVTVVVCAVVIFGVIQLGLRAKHRGDATRVTRGVAWAGIFFWLVQMVHAFGFDWKPAHSWPLHVCDIAGLLGPIALLTQARLLRTTVYFWAMGLAVWGVITPTLWKGPDSVVFWLFWINHGGVILFALYDVVVNVYRPTLKDWGWACVVSLAYVAVVVPLNLAHPGWNYGYLGDVEVGRKTPLDLLPPWPWRLLAIEVLGAAMMLHAWLPWAIARKFNSGRILSGTTEIPSVSP